MEHVSFDGFYDIRDVQNRIMYDLIVQEFAELSLEEKVDKLIHAYAADRVYGKVEKRRLSSLYGEMRG